MKTLLYNGKFYIEKNVFAEAVLIKDNLIYKIGKNSELLKLNFDKKIDLNGKTCLPGFNDSHLHAYGVGGKFKELNLENVASIDDIISICKNHLNKNKNLNKLIGMHWNQHNFKNDNERCPNRYDLDKISKDIPIFLERNCYHKCVVNSKALEMYDVSKYPNQNEIELFKNGEYSGLLSEGACFWIKAKICPQTLEDKKLNTLKAFEYALSLGITSLQSNDIGFDETYEEYEYIRELSKNKDIKIRYTLQSVVKKVQDIESVIVKEKNSTYYNNDKFRFGPIKLFKDGSIGSSTALMSNEYINDKGNFGISTLSKETHNNFVKKANKCGIQVITHAIGDKAIEETLDVYENNLVNGKNKFRNGIVHCQITSDKLLKRISKSEILVYYQPIFLASDMHILDEKINTDLINTSYAHNTLNKLGGKISYGTDGPIEDINPFYNIYVAVNRQDFNHFPKNGHTPHEKVDIYTAIDAYTIGSAYAEFMENKKGRIKKGYFADLIVLDNDIFTIDTLKIKEINCIITIVDGEIVYKKNK